MSDIKATFLGPQAENDRFFEELMLEAFRDYVFWRRNFHPEDGRLIKEADKREQDFEETNAKLRQELLGILSELKGGVPLYSTRHLGHMVSDQLMAAQVGYIAALLYNQNNVTGEVSPVTTAREFDYIDSLAEMMGLRPVARREGEEGSWGHLASGGTTANMEALWAARNLKYYAVSLKLLSREDARFLGGLDVCLPGGGTEKLGALSARALLDLAPQESYELREKAARAYQEERQQQEAGPQQQLDKDLRPHSVQHLGIAGLMQACEGALPLPKIYVPHTAHYCWKKAADVLGLGQGALVKIDVDERYRMKAEHLRAELDPEHPTLMVVGVAGTTEEGAFDPLGDLVQIRAEMEQQRGHSFWLHADAAWGGYFAALLPGMEPPNDSGDDDSGSDQSWEGRDWQGRANHIKEFFEDLKNDAQPVELFEQGYPVTADWVRHVQALSEVDSVVVDPHKLGYIPYPAGAVLFADDRAKDAVSHDAPYLAWKGDADEGIERKFMGRWTLEGSQPGASAVACYLAQEVLPHDRSGHGKVVAQTMVGAQRLHLALRQHNESNAGVEDAFEIVPLCRPETNVLCYLVTAPSLVRHPRHLNALAEKVFDRMTVKGDRPVADYEYFISKTSLAYDDYTENVKGLLEEAGIPKAHRDGLKGETLTVLRSVVMNPLVSEMEQSFFEGFWEEVTAQAREALPTILLNIIEEQDEGEQLRILWIEDEAGFEKMRRAMQVYESIGQYFDIRRVSQPGEVADAADEFDPQLSIVDLNLIGGHEGVDLQSGLDIIQDLQERGLDDIIVYSQYLRDGAATPAEASFDAAPIVKQELEGLGVPPEFQLAKSMNAADRRAEDVGALIRKIFRLAQ
jgi:glutamate/tyrosine decarboxylase-like PLP-dependent enzyme